MSGPLFSAVRKIFAGFTTVILAAVFAAQAQAVVINFDDLTFVPLDPDSPSFGDHPLGDEYRSQGLLIGNAFLLPYGADDDIISGRNYLLAGASGSPMELAFIGQLPTFVGMYIGGSPSGVLYTNAYGPSGLVASHQKESSGWEYVTFEFATGISQIEMWATQQQRVSGASIDDITFTYSSVPEPSSFILWVLVFFVLFCRRKVNMRWYIFKYCRSNIQNIFMHHYQNPQLLKAGF